MKGAFNIFGRLKDHEITPPAELTAYIRESVSIASPFERLRDHSIPPPAEIFSSLERQTNIRPPAGKRKTLFAASAAAAILCGIVLTTFVLTKPKPATPISKYTPNTQTPVADTVSKTISSPDTLTNRNTHIAKKRSNPSPTIGNQPLTLTGNDLLLTFTSYSNPQLQELIRQEGEKDVSIRIDQYSNITLSRSMSSMLKDLYLTRTNGKPTRHARKTKEKLDNWKNIDQKFFDNAAAISPIDPADLSSFVANPSSHPSAPTLKGQPSLPAIENQGERQNDLTVSWQLAIHSKKDNSGIGETYNGGIKTLFVKGTHARIRLVALMRIQSAFLTTDHGRLQNIVLAKESGAPQNIRLDAAQLTHYQQKYNGAGLRLTDDTLNVLQYSCKKAILKLEDGRELTAWYTPQLHSPEAALLEPVFSKIPGLVLKYEIAYKRKTISYTATYISRRSIKDDVCMPNAGETK